MVPPHAGQRRALLKWLSLLNFAFLLLLWLLECCVVEKFPFATVLLYIPQHPLGIPTIVLLAFSLWRKQWKAASIDALAGTFFLFALLNFNVPTHLLSHSGGLPLRVMTYNKAPRILIHRRGAERF